MNSLYELTQSFETFVGVLDTCEDSEFAEALAEALENLKDDIEIKIENYAKAIRIKEAHIGARKAEINRLKDGNATDEKSIERMKQIMQAAMALTDKPKIETSLFKLSIRKSPPHVVIDEQYLENIPEKYLVAQEPKIDKKQMLEDLKDEQKAKKLEGICHAEQTTYLKID